MNPSPPATPPAAPQVQPPPWLRPWSVEWRAPGATRLHRRVRWTVYLAFLVLAAALLLQAAVHVQGEQARSGEAALLDMAGLQRTFSQQMAWRPARLALAETQTQIQTQRQTQTQTDNDALAADDRSEQAVALERLLNTSMQEALQFEALVAQQLQTAGDAQAGLAAALDDWLAVRERLWHRGGALLHHVRAAPNPGDAAPAVATAAVAVQLEAKRALQAAQLLSDRLRALAEHRGQRQRADLKLWAAGLLVLLGLLALAVVEPTVRRVRRQLGLLQAQALSLKQLALVAERTRAMVLITDAQGGTVWANQAFTDITGWPLAQALGQQPAALLGTAEAAADDEVATTTATTTAAATAECSLRAALASGVGVRIDCRARARDGSALWLDCDLQPVHDDEGRLTGWVNVNHDVTVRRSLQDQLHASARTDALTRLPNRAAVMERLQRAIEHARRHPGYGFAVLFMDFDRFKQVNDTLGHTMGDDLLRQIAARLETTLRPGDAVARVDSDLQLAARLGGDEFVVVLEGVHDASTVGAVADRLLADLRADADSVLRDADTAMYEAKRGGRHRYVIFDRSMQERVAHALTVEHELRRALEGDELFVVYQPVVDLASRRLTAVEALVRWRHPRRGLVPPVEFIGIAEECGLIDAVGDFVLRSACAQFAQWQRTLGEAAPPVLAVNLSRAQLRVAGLVPEVKWVLEQHGMQPQQLQLEVTESLAAQDEGVQHTLRELKALGVSLALDDFGTGYSSLACLHQLPVDRVKVDRSFVMHAQTVEYHRVLIEATIRVARTLGMVTVAEGIETEGQAQLMHELQCDYGQGYLFARPLDAQALVAWVQQRQEQQPQQPQQQALAQAAG